MHVLHLKKLQKWAYSPVLQLEAGFPVNCECVSSEAPVTSGLIVAGGSFIF